MYYNANAPSTPASSYVSAKSSGWGTAQTASPPWSARGSLDGASTTGSVVVPSGPSAPRMGTVPLPHGGPSTPPRSTNCEYPASCAALNLYSRGPTGGLPTPPISPETPVTRLHPFLALVNSPTQHPPVQCDVTRPPNEIHISQNDRPFTLGDQAISPSQQRLFVRYKTWTIDVTNRNGVTVGDVLATLCYTMQTPVTSNEFSQFRPDDQGAATQYFTARTAGNEAAYKQGLIRCDFVGRKRFFVGLVRAHDGSDRWDLQLAQF